MYYYESPQNCDFWHEEKKVLHSTRNNMFFKRPLSFHHHVQNSRWSRHVNIIYMDQCKVLLFSIHCSSPRAIEGKDTHTQNQHYVPQSCISNLQIFDKLSTLLGVGSLLFLSDMPTSIIVPASSVPVPGENFGQNQSNMPV